MRLVRSDLALPHHGSKRHDQLASVKGSAAVCVEGLERIVDRFCELRWRAWRSVYRSWHHLCSEQFLNILAFQKGVRAILYPPEVVQSIYEGWMKRFP